MTKANSEASKGFWARMSDQERIRFIERRKEAAVNSRYRVTDKGQNVNLAKGVSRETS
jgi:hypothetical protein